MYFFCCLPLTRPVHTRTRATVMSTTPIVDNAFAKWRARRRFSNPSKKAKRVPDPTKPDPIEQEEFLNRAVNVAKYVDGKLRSSMHGPLANEFPGGVWEPSDSPAVHMLQSLQAQVDACHDMGRFETRNRSYFAAHLEDEYGLTYKSVSQTIAEHIEEVRKEHETQRAGNLTADLSSLPLLYEWDLPGVPFPELDLDKMVNGHRNMSIGEVFDRALAVLVLNVSIGSSTLSKDIHELVETVQPYAQQFEDTAKATADAQTREHLPDLPELWTQYANPSKERATLFNALWKRHAEFMQTSAGVSASLDATSTLPTGVVTKRPGAPNLVPPGMDYVGEGARWPGTGAMDTFASDNATCADWFTNVGKYHCSWVKRRPIAAVSAAAVPLALGLFSFSAPVVLASHVAISAVAWFEDTNAQKYLVGTAGTGGVGTTITALTSGRAPLRRQFYALDRCAMPEQAVRKPLIDMTGDVVAASEDATGSYVAMGAHSWWTGTVGPVAKEEIQKEVQEKVRLGTKTWVAKNVHRKIRALAAMANGDSLAMADLVAYEAESAALSTPIKETTIKGIIERTVECTRSAAGPGGDKHYASDIRAAAKSMDGGTVEILARDTATQMWGNGARQAVKAPDGDGWLSPTWSKNVGTAITGLQSAVKVVFDYHRRYKPDRARLYLYNNRPGANNEMTLTSSQIALQAVTINMLSVLHGHRTTTRPGGEPVSKWLKDQKKQHTEDTEEWQDVYSKKDTVEDPVVKRPYQRPLFNDYNKKLFLWADQVTALVKKLRERRTLLEEEFGIGVGVNFKSLLTFTKIRGSEEWKTISNAVDGKNQLKPEVKTDAFRTNKKYQLKSVSNQFYALYLLMDTLMNRAMGYYDEAVALNMEDVVNLIDELNEVYTMIDENTLLGNTPEKKNRVRNRLRKDGSFILAWHVQPLQFKTDGKSVQAFVHLKQLFNKYLEPRETFNDHEPLWTDAYDRSEADFRKDEEAAEAAAEAAGNVNAPYDGPARGTRRQRREEAHRQAAELRDGNVPEQNADNLLQLLAPVPDLFRDAGINPDEILANGVFGMGPLRAEGPGAAGVGFQASVVDEVYARVSALRL